MRRQSGFTLVEVSAVLGVAAVLAGVAMPTYQKQLQQARRGEGVAAVAAVQAAQERYRNNSGAYAPTLATLKTASLSASGLYAVSLQLDGADGYTVTAQGQGVQAGDSACSPLTLTVRQGFENVGPSMRCWGR